MTAPRFSGTTYDPARAQLPLDFARRERDRALQRITRVVSPDFLERAAAFVEQTLRERGASSGEVLVSLCELAGIRSTDSRHFGAVLRRLSARGVIECCGYCERAKGHGTAGARLWRIKA